MPPKGVEVGAMLKRKVTVAHFGRLRKKPKVAGKPEIADLTEEPEGDDLTKENVESLPKLRARRSNIRNSNIDRMCSFLFVLLNKLNT